MAGERIFKPVIVQTKQQLLLALRKGKLKSAKYNVLDDEEKEFVELMVFGDYTREQAAAVMYPDAPRAAKTRANRMIANPDVADAIAELSVQKDKSFMSELLSARDLALEKILYIMTTTKDEAVAAACAKVLLESGAKVIKDTLAPTDKNQGITFHIESANFHATPTTEFDKDEPVIVEGPPVERSGGKRPPELVLDYSRQDHYNQKGEE